MTPTHQELLSQNAMQRAALKDLLDRLPCGLTSKTTYEITVHDHSGGKSTMGENLTAELIHYVKQAESVLSQSPGEALEALRGLLYWCNEYVMTGEYQNKAEEALTKAKRIFGL